MVKYNAVQVEKMLSSLVILYDTREVQNRALETRREQFKRPSERFYLQTGDYTGKYQNIAGEWLTMENIAICERKSGLSELCQNFTSGRQRFQREFERAKDDGCRVHIIVENATYEHIFNHKYRSQLSPQSLIASILSWQARFCWQLHFCKAETTGKLISQILYYELREYLLNKEE